MNSTKDGKLLTTVPVCVWRLADVLEMIIKKRGNKNGK